MDNEESGTDSGQMTASEVADEEFSAILRQTREYVRRRVVPRENEIVAYDTVPDGLRAEAAAMGLFGYANPWDCGVPRHRSPLRSMPAAACRALLSRTLVMVASFSLTAFTIMP